MSIDWQNILFNFLGGLGLFLYSIKTMGEGLQQAAGIAFDTILINIRVIPF